MSMSLNLIGISWLNLKRKREKKDTFNVTTSEIRHINTMTGDKTGGLSSQLISNSSLPTQPMRCLSLHRVLGPLLFRNSSVDSFTSYQGKCCETGPLDLKQRQHILLSYFKTVRVGPRGTVTWAHCL